MSPPNPPRSVEAWANEFEIALIIECGHDADCPAEWEEYPDRFGPCNCQMKRMMDEFSHVLRAYATEQVAEKEAYIGTLKAMLVEQDKQVAQALGKLADEFYIASGVEGGSHDIAGTKWTPADLIRATVAQARAEEREALEESVRLQSHYAELLNQYDGGQRIIFKDADDWKRRRAMTPQERIKDAAIRARRDEE